MGGDTAEHVAARRSGALRALCFLACVPSGGALLAKVYGVASLQWVTLVSFVPGIALMVTVWAFAPPRWPRLGEDLTVGFWGGLLGTIAYDLFRLPFTLVGYRLFAQHGLYGIWVMDASHATPTTEAMGWLYHFSNGITFGIVYALVMRGRHWGWAVVWALALESIAVFSPFGAIFGLRTNYPVLAMAYTAHVAYGVPLGLVTRWPERFLAWLQGVPRLVWTLMAVVAAAPFVGLFAADVMQEERPAPGQFEVHGASLTPGWLRIERGDSFRVSNPGDAGVAVAVQGAGRSEIAAGQTVQITPSQPGIYQVYVVTEGRTRSSFLAVEPVEDAP